MQWKTSELFDANTKYGLAPDYLCDLVSPYIPNRHLRSSFKNTIVPPKIKTKSSGERSFEFAAAAEWNALPEELRFCSSFTVFKAKLKTHFFNVYFKTL